MSFYDTQNTRAMSTEAHESNRVDDQDKTVCLEDELIKVIVIGDSTVGKTSFILRYVNNTFRPEYKATIGVDFSLKVVKWNDAKKFKIQLWDIAGQERFTFMTRAYYKDARGCLLLYDIANRKSFEQVVKWKKDLDSKVRMSDGSVLPCLLVANKIDLTDRKVTEKEMASLCKSHKFIGWTETSAKDGHKVTEAMNCLLDVIQGKASCDTVITDSVRLSECDEDEHKKPKWWSTRCKC